MLQVDYRLLFNYCLQKRLNHTSLITDMQICMNASDSKFSALVRENSIGSNDLIYWDMLQVRILSSHP